MLFCALSTHRVETSSCFQGGGLVPSLSCFLYPFHRIAGGWVSPTRDSFVLFRHGPGFSLSMSFNIFRLLPVESVELGPIELRNISHGSCEVWSLGGSCEGSTRSAFSKLIWAIASQDWFWVAIDMSVTVDCTCIYIYITFK